MGAFPRLVALLMALPGDSPDGTRASIRRSVGYQMFVN
jgi:hypothetical protein